MDDHVNYKKKKEKKKKRKKEEEDERVRKHPLSSFLDFVALLNLRFLWMRQAACCNLFYFFL